MNKTNYITEGVNGSGQTVYMVVTEVDGRWTHIERFTSLKEAQSWLKWAC